jgi:SNF2 family DNA or RNA helicase
MAGPNETQGNAAAGKPRWTTFLSGIGDLDPRELQQENEFRNASAFYQNLPTAISPEPMVGFQFQGKAGNVDEDDITAMNQLEAEHMEDAFRLLSRGLRMPDPREFRSQAPLISQSPPGFRTEGDGSIRLREHQRDGVERMIAIMNAKSPGCCLADEMGLGKTAQVLAFLTSIKRSGPSLIVAPSRLLAQWALAIDQYLEDGALKYLIYRGDARFENLGKTKTYISTTRLSTYDVVFTSYDLIQRESAKQQEYQLSKSVHQRNLPQNEFNKSSWPKYAPDEPGDFPLLDTIWEICVLDDGHKVCDITSQTAKGCARLLTGFRICVTATRFQKWDKDIFGILNWLQIEPCCGFRWFSQVSLSMVHGLCQREVRLTWTF